jgi:nitrogen fixation NifU-like protein
MQYTEKVLDHFQKPRNMGQIPNASGVGEVGNATCGDIMRIYLSIEDNVIVDVKFQTYGCGAAVATTSMLTELVKGKTVDEALLITNADVAKELGGLPPVKMHCSNLAADALKVAIENYKSQQNLKGE